MIGYRVSMKYDNQVSILYEYSIPNLFANIILYQCLTYPWNKN